MAENKVAEVNIIVNIPLLANTLDPWKRNKIPV